MVGDAAARRCPERDINTRLPVAIEGFVLIFSGNLAEIRWLGPGAWHLLDPSWVPLPVPGAGKIYWGHGVRGLASPDSLVGATQSFEVDGVRDGDFGVPVPQIIGK